MKVSIVWIFDHIQADWRKQDIQNLIATVGAKSTEVEHVQEIVLPLESLSLARVVKSHPEKVTLYSQEWRKEVSLPVVSKQV